MSLFSDSPYNSPADRATDMLYNRADIWHEGLRWRADTLRNLADQLDALDEIIQSGVSQVLLELGRSILAEGEHQDGKLEADDHR